MGTISEKLTYLNVTKQKLKQAINNIGGEVTDETTFRNYVNQLENAYDRLPKTEFEEGESVTLENTLKGKLNFQDGKVGFGQARQETTQGINLLNYITNLKTNFQGLISQINDDGSITTTGTPAYDYVGIIDINITSMLEVGQSYTISQKTASPYLYLQINATNTQTSQSTFYFLVNETSKTFTVQANTTYILRLQTPTRAVWGTDSRTLTNFYQLEKSSTAHTFEQYTGGYSSPSPNWEQQVKCVAGRNKLPTYEIKKFTASADAWCSLDGISNFYNQTNIAPSKVFCILKANQTYTISVYQKANTNNVQLVDYTGTVLLTGIETQAKQYMPSTDIKVYPRLKVTSSNTETYCYMQIEEGSQATPYLPYNTIEEVVSGKNLFDKNSVEILDGYYLNGTTGQNMQGGTSSITNTYISVKPNTTYTLTNNYTNKIVEYGQNKSFVKNNTTNLVTFATEATTYYIRFQFPTDTKNVNTIQLEEGSTATTYEPYITPTSYQLSLGDIELNAIGNYKDELIYDVENDRVYKNEVITRKILTGANTEFWQVNTITGAYVFAYGVTNYKRTNELICMCNYFKAIVNGTYGSMTDGQCRFRYYNDELYNFYVCMNDITNVSDFRTWLGTHNLDLYYVLATPTQIEITDSALKQQVKNWYYGQSLNGTTIVTGSGNLPMVIKIRALKGE